MGVTREIVANTNNGKQTVKAVLPFIDSLFAVHRSLTAGSDLWTITHIPTGLRVPWAESFQRGSALQLAAALNERCPAAADVKPDPADAAKCLGPMADFGRQVHCVVFGGEG